jgi:hypothetical protein
MASRVVLPEEAPDLTATPFHNEVAIRLYTALGFLFAAKATVLFDVFLRVDEVKQVAPDLLVVHEPPGVERRVFRIPPGPVPDVTVEVLSTVNDTAFGRRKLEEKRSLFGAVGVPVHLELDPERGLFTTWHNLGGHLTPGPSTDRYDGDELGGLRIELSPGEVRFWLPDGREFIDGPTEIARADRLAEALRKAGIDPDSV